MIFDEDEFFDGKKIDLNDNLAHFAERAQSDDKRDPVVRAAPTGIAAYNISGRTLHSLLRLPVRSKYLTTMHPGPPAGALA